MYPSQVFFMMPDSSNNPRHEILGSFSWFSCYNADFRAVFVCFCTTFDLIFEISPISLVNFCLLRLTLPFGGIYREYIEIVVWLKDGYSLPNIYCIQLWNVRWLFTHSPPPLPPFQRLHLGRRLMTFVLIPVFWILISCGVMSQSLLPIFGF